MSVSLRSFMLISCLFALAAIFVSCSTDQSSYLSDSENADQRVHLTYVDVDVSVNPFDDMVQIDAGVGFRGDHCEFIDPIDPSNDHYETVLSSWSPLQIYWAIYDKQADVQRTSIPDVYFEGDDLQLELLPVISGKNVLGVMSLNENSRQYVKFSNFRFSEDRSTMSLDAAAPMNAKLRAFALLDGDRCKTAISYCQSGRCEEDSDFTPFQTIHVKAGLFGTKVTYK